MPSTKRFIRSILGRFGVDIVRVCQPDLIGFVHDRDIDVVLDVGANVGQFGENLRARGYRGKIVSFEPLASAYRTLAEKAQADGNWEVHRLALGAVSGTATLNVSEASTYSSLMPIANVAMLHDPSAVTTRKETIEIRTLDEIFPVLSGNVLLKIDTQGYERQVLEGARQRLPVIKGILMELPIINLYEGTWNFHEAIEFMVNAGFVPAQINPVNYHRLDRLSLLEVDCLFRPCDKRLDRAPYPDVP